MSDKTGGPAFPITLNPGEGYDKERMGPADGMTIRDYFAAKAMQQFMAWALDQPTVVDYDSADKAAARYAKSAFLMADAMLEARAK